MRFCLANFNNSVTKWPEQNEKMKKLIKIFNENVLLAVTLNPILLNLTFTITRCLFKIAASYKKSPCYKVVNQISNLNYLYSQFFWMKVLLYWSHLSGTVFSKNVNLNNQICWRPKWNISEVATISNNGSV